MRAAILAVGDELICGYRLDTNSQAIARRLSAISLDIVLHIAAQCAHARTQPRSGPRPGRQPGHPAPAGSATPPPGQCWRVADPPGANKFLLRRGL